MIILCKNGPEEKDEPHSVSNLKWTFISCILARLLLASVRIRDEPNIVFDDITFDGYAKFPMDGALADIRYVLGIKEEWIMINQLDSVLIRLSGLLLIHYLMTRKGNVKAGYGNDNLIKVSRDPPGKIINRFVQNKVKFNPNHLFTYIEAWKGAI